MNLAQELNIMANETDRVVRKICTTLTTRMFDRAQNGGQEIQYIFVAKTKEDIKENVKLWLTDQGFKFSLDEEGDLTITWDVLTAPHRMTLSDRVRERITAATRYEKDSVTLSTATFSPDEVEAAVDELLHDGFTVDVDHVFNEISVSWE